jgi:putative N6-adenine-specific DNA methylase
MPPASAPASTRAGPTCRCRCTCRPNHATLYVDTSGEALFKRGWRDGAKDKGEAPLKETLAAAMLAAAGWQGRAEDGPLLDPCCGAGTIAIEAAQIACGIAPGCMRRFAFERMLPFAACCTPGRDLQRRRRRACMRPRCGVRRRRELPHDRLRHAQRRAGGVSQHAIEFKTADACSACRRGRTGHADAEPALRRAHRAQGAGAAVARARVRSKAAAVRPNSSARWRRTGSATTPAGRPGC